MAYKPFKVNVLDVLDEAYSSDQIKDSVREFVLEPEFKRLYGQRMVDRIVNRTRDLNIDKNGRSLGKYSTEYKNSLIFKIYNKSNPVDLTLTGEMLESIAAEYTRALIFIDVDDSNKGKAEGHITGKLGKKGRAKPRDFLGLPSKEVKSIFKESLKDYREGAVLELLV